MPRGMALAEETFMRSLAASLAGLGLLAVLSLHCGGRVDAESPDCPQNITSACSSGTQCTQHLTDCEGNHALSCSCNGGVWKCPQLGAPSCPNPCAGATNGAACSSQGLFCPASVQPPCVTNDRLDGCSCEKGRFVCSATICSEPPLPVCPPPSAVVEGSSCGGPVTCMGVHQCPQGGSVNVDFDCVNGRWTMQESFQDPCDGVITIDAGTKG